MGLSKDAHTAEASFATRRASGNHNCVGYPEAYYEKMHSLG